MELEKLKKMIQEEVEAHRQELIDLSLRIHANPELGWHEEKASGWLSDYLENKRFKVERGICELPTAFRAGYGQGKPVVAIMAEYDALPDVGHGCGHNIIGTSAVGAGLAAKLVVEKFGGTILVMGSPAEELLGGKVVMAERGAFDGIDVAMMVHPRRQSSTVARRHLSAIFLEVEFWGKAAHAAGAPWDGISALEALILGINNMNALRFHTRESTRLSGIITDGGKAANVIPEHAAGTFQVRAVDDASLDELREKVLNCFKGAALATGTRLEYRWGLRCSYMRHNPTLIQLWSDNMQALGRKVAGFDDSGSGSIDMGNVSVLVPSIHPFIAISSTPLPPHSHEFATASASDAGMKALIDGAKALAMTAADVISRPQTLSRIKEEFLNPSKQL
jgi:amidohydrolase